MDPAPTLNSQPRRHLPESVRALTIHQPWATLIAEGYKDVENRVWTTAYRGPLLIHAGKRIDPAGVARAGEVGLVIDQLPGGAFVALCRLEGVVTDSDSPWAIPGGYHWELAEVVRLREPVPARGAQRLWSPDPSDLAKIEVRGVRAAGLVGADGLAPVRIDPPHLVP